MNRIATLLYGAVCYVVFFVTFLYTIGFLANIGVPKSIDSGTAGPPWIALLANGVLLAVFAAQHSVMARQGFKARLARFLPREIERSTYVLASSLALIALYAFWQPIPDAVWTLNGGFGWSLLTGIYLLGVALVLYSTFLIDHFDLFGLRQVVLHFRGREYSEKRFATPSLYRFIRHPLYVGWLVTFWATPAMSVGHLFFAVVTTAYIFVAIPMEERDLSHLLGEEYRRYRARTPLMVPGLRSTGSGATPSRVPEAH